MFRWARKRDILDVNPLSDIEAPGGDEVARERTLTDTEIVALWNGLPAINVSESIRLAAKLVLVTAQRPGEVAGARVNEFDLGRAIWNLPPERTKNGLPHVVPLSPMAVELVKAAMETTARNGWLLARRYGDAPISAISLATAFLDHRGRLGIPDLPKPDDAVAANVKAMVTWRRERRRLAYAPHDLRRTAATRMTELGHPRFIVDKVLNHVEPGVGKIYDRHTYTGEKRRALEAWARELDAILTGRKAEKVVALRPA
jgi:integrase